MQCKGRYTKEKNGLKFPTKGFYFTEKRCGEIATQDELCNECLEKRKKTIVKDELNYTPKYQQYSFQGKVDEDYYENSWIYGSPRYLKWAGIDGNTLKPKELAVAEAAQRIARGTLEMKVKAPKTEAKKLEMGPWFLLFQGPQQPPQKFPRHLLLLIPLLLCSLSQRPSRRRL